MTLENKLTEIVRLQDLMIGMLFDLSEVRERNDISQNIILITQIAATQAQLMVVRSQMVK